MERAGSRFKLKHLCSTALLCALFLAAPAAAQSLDPDKPFPMKAGANRGTVDNIVGANYFYFWAGPGDVKVRVSFAQMGGFATGGSTTLNIELSDEKKTWTTHKAVTSAKQAGEIIIPGTLKEKTKVIVSLIPPGKGLLRAGGDYEVEATGAVQFDTVDTGVDPVIGVYKPMVTYENEESAVKFLANGTLVFASGTQGKWTLFDATDRIYTVTFGRTQLSLKLMLGRGLVDMNDSSIVFQRSK